VTKAERRNDTVIISVLFVNRSAKVLSLSGDDSVSVSLAYGEAGSTADEDFDTPTNQLEGAVPPGEKRTGGYAYKVPGRNVKLTVSLTIYGLTDAWRGAA
jgi:hypothetical protein